MPFKGSVTSLLRAVPRKRRKPLLAPKKTPRQSRACTTFDSILSACAHLLEDVGYERTTTNGIADVAGIAVGALYSYFPNKEAVVAELARRTLKEILDEVAQTFASVAEIADRDVAIEQLVRRCARVLSQRRKLLKALFEQVPFMQELDETRAFPMKLFAIAWQARGIVKPNIAESNVSAKAYLYLLIPIGRWVPYVAVIDRPPWISERAAEDAMVSIFRRLLA